MNKKIIWTVAVAVVALIIAGTAMFFYYQGAPAIDDTANGELPSGGDRGIFGIIGGDKDKKNGQVTEKKLISQIFKNPISGAAFASSTSSVRLVERATGNIFEINPEGGATKRISNNTILQSFNVAWSNDANGMVIQYTEENNGADTIRTFVSSLSTLNSTSSKKGDFLAPGIKTITSSAETNEFFYFSNEGGVNLGSIFSFDTKKTKQIASSPFGDFLATWPNKNNIFLLTKPSYQTSGHLFSLDVKTGLFKKVLGEIKGLLAVVSPDGKKVIYSQSENKGFSSYFFDVEKQETKRADFNALAEKCLWSKKEKNVVFCATPDSPTPADYPDSWYMGLTSFSDSLWKINLESGVNTQIVKTDSDITNLFASTDEKYLFFTNKKDGSLWSVLIEE